MASKYVVLRREFSHVYVAKCGRFTKVGATNNVERRLVSLSYDNRIKARLVKAWPVSDGYEVEGTAIWLLAKDYKRDRREWFKAPIKPVIAAVEQAIMMVEAGTPAPFTPSRAEQQRREKQAAEFRAAAEEANAWVAAHPEEYARLCRQWKSTYERN